METSGIVHCQPHATRVGIGEESLEAAERLAADNALVHYVWGVYYVTMSENQRYSQPIPSEIEVPVRPPVHTCQLCEPIMRLRAEYHFQRAIELSALLCEDELLTSREGNVVCAHCVELHNSTTSGQPTVGELLTALGCEDYLAKSHLGLGQLAIDRDSLAEAEQHLIQAADRGLAVCDQWMQLGKCHDASERYDDAARVYLRAMSQSRSVVTPLSQAIKSVTRSFE